jgi:hypothetical protein
MPLVKIHKSKIKPRVPEYFIISKDKAKLGYYWKSAVLVRKDTCYCPQCGIALMDEQGFPLPSSNFEQNKKYCETCHSPLWQADGNKIRRFAPAEFIKRYLKGFFTTLICDEVHEMKSGYTAQGNVLGMLAGCIEKVITLTGTLMSGYSDDLLYILYRTSPRLMKDEGFEWGETQKFLELYGILERVSKTSINGEDNAASRGSKKRENVRRRPGVSPLVYSKFLLGNTVFLQLDDIADNLPLLTEEVRGIPMGKELSDAYMKLDQTIGQRVRQEMGVNGNSCLLGTYLATLLAYPDKPFGWSPIIHPKAKAKLPEEYFYLPHKEQQEFLKRIAQEGLFDPSDIIAVPPELSEDNLYPKEKILLEILEQEILEKRRCFVYCVYTNTHDTTARLESLVRKKGFKVVVLKSSVVPEHREEWLKEKVSEGYEVIIGNPELVKTGLDLLDFPTLIFFQTGYSTFTLRQSSRRSWRIGQRRDVKVFYLYYENTMQERALQLIGAKLEASIGIEGKFSEEGLVAMSSGDDLMNALAKAIVGKLEPSDSAENIWKRMAEKGNGKPKSIPFTPVNSESETINEPFEEKIVFLELIRKQGKRRIIQRVEGKEEEIDEVLKEKGCMAQLLLF